ncbi:MAG: zinc-binding dehydrogenase [Nonomuraea sp.]|nr:zinc-binding dehydrogenase [Nonomuraea sp.]
MRAARLHRYGDPAEITSFNPSEVGHRRGSMPVTFPHTLGWDVAGTAGDRPVIAMADGAAAEYVTVPLAHLVDAPASIPLADAAALPLAGLTAWQAVFEYGKARPGERVLVTGASGGIGRLAVQLVRHAGATPVAARRGEDPGGGYDLVLNLAPIAPPLAGERIVTITLPAPGATHFITRNDPAQLAELVALVDAGVVRVEIAERHPLGALAEIHRRAEAGDIHGKIIIEELA